MVSIPHNTQTSSLEESDKLEATKELIEVEWRKMKEADDSVLRWQESLQSEEKWSSTRTSAWRTRHPACWAGGRTTRKSCQSCPRWWRRFWRCQPRQQRARECLVLVQTSSPHDCLPPPASHHHHCNHHYDQVAISSQRREPRLHQRKLRSFFGAKMMLLHSVEKPFVCNHCGYSTIKDDHLKMHKRVHSGVKPFACKQCIYSC